MSSKPDFTNPKSLFRSFLQISVFWQRSCDIRPETISLLQEKTGQTTCQQSTTGKSFWKKWTFGSLLSSHWSLFLLSTTNWFITVHRSKSGKTFSWKVVTKLNKSCCSSKQLPACVLKTNFQFSEQHLLVGFVKKSFW